MHLVIQVVTVLEAEGENIQMNIINSSAPISIDHLKEYFSDSENTSFLIDYDNSSLKEEKFLTYLSNLDIPCDIKIDYNSTEHFSLFKKYLETGNLVNIPSLEKWAIVCLLEKKELISGQIFKKFICDNLSLIEEWEKRLNSLTLYNLYILKDDFFRKWVIEEHEEEVDNSNAHINFVNLLKYEDLYLFFNSVDEKNLKYYPVLFNEYCFRGKNLYEFWANENNPLFLLTWGIASGNFDKETYQNLKEETVL